MRVGAHKKRPCSYEALMLGTRVMLGIRGELGRRGVLGRRRGLAMRGGLGMRGGSYEALMLIRSAHAHTKRSCLKLESCSGYGG
jgi:hypothetical protein